jgi:hypothetical protein
VLSDIGARHVNHSPCLVQLFGMVGPIKEVIMGLNQVTRKPCGFAFVIYYSHKAAQSAASYVTGTKLDNRYIRVDIDWGFEPGRQFGRGKTGGQVRLNALTPVATYGLWPDLGISPVDSCPCDALCHLWGHFKFHFCLDIVSLVCVW